MRKMGAHPVFPVPRTTVTNSQHRENLYLLRGTEVYIRSSEGMKECPVGIGAFIDRYSSKHNHSSLDRHTPSDLYFKQVVLKMAR